MTLKKEYLCVFDKYGIGEKVEHYCFLFIVLNCKLGDLFNLFFGTGYTNWDHSFFEFHLVWIHPDSFDWWLNC